ncbi:MAG: porphobilinogen synthase [Campylobacterales bacterium]|nr:porphobilinogen synthase [Campylobacterales bacterium]
MFKRFRRLRTNESIRSLVRETVITKDDLIYPLFIKSGENFKKEIDSMPGVFQFSIDKVLIEIEDVVSKGIKAVILFGIPQTKDSIGSDALDNHGIIATALRAIKEKFPDLYVITDLCFCEYTDHGHCGIINSDEDVDNDSTLEILAKQALVHLEAGADMLAPSGMMDGTIETLREALDLNGYENTPIMAYSTKFASGYYGPFRDVAESTPTFGDRRKYQMDPANINEAVNESIEDEMQGADILMVKPALAYLDVVRAIKEKTSLPMCVYNVSGEYAMLKNAGAEGLIDYERVMMETMIGFKRAGADLIITYHAKEVCDLLD